MAQRMPWQDVDPRVGHTRGAKRSRRRQHLPARQTVEVRVSQVDCDALPGVGPLGGHSVHLQRAHRRRHSGRDDVEHVVDVNRSVDQGAGDDGTEASHGEHAVDRQSRRAARVA